MKKKIFLIIAELLVLALSFTGIPNFISKNSVPKDAFAAGEPLYINAPVTVGATFSLTSPIFYDKANSAYFLDPAATDNSLTVAGNVGIGTTAPEGILHVWDTANDVSALLVSDGTYIQNTLEVSSPFGIPLTVQGNSYFNGNVGIGTTAPRSKLEVVNGTANTNADVAGVAGNYTGPTQTGQGSLLSLESNDAVAADTGGILGFGGRYSGTAYANWASIKGLKTNLTSGDYSGYLSFFTRLSGAGSVERMRIDNTGNVGIGTTAPASKLSVGGVGDATYAIYATGGTYAAVVGQGGTIGTYGSGTTYGVYGAGPYGVYGTGTSYGVYGNAASGGVGVWGAGHSGVNGNSTAAAGVGVQGNNNVTNNNGFGVYAGNSSATGYAIWCQAGANVNGCGGNRAWSGTSDARLKKDIVTIPNALDKVMHLRGVDFNWIDGSGADMGFIAQEVLPYVPEVISQDATTGIYSMRTSQLTGLLVEAVKEQQAQIASLQKATGNLTLSGTGDLEITGGVDHPVVKKGNISILDSFGAFTELVTAKIRAGIIETKKLVVDGVDIAKKLTELSNKVDTQQKQIDELQTELEQLKANK